MFCDLITEYNKKKGLRIFLIANIYISYLYNIYILLSIYSIENIINLLTQKH